MTDHHSDLDDGPLPELTPEQESEVRRLLAEARHDEPVPADVAARLDAALAGLGRDDPGAPGVAPVIDLAAHRRRRNAAAVLAGAAAVIVAGFAIGQVIDVGGSDNGDAGASSGDVAADRAESQGASADAVPRSLSSAEPSPSVPMPAGQPLLRLSSDHLERDLARQLDQVRAADGSGGSPAASSFSAISCPPPTPGTRFGLGELFPALFDGKPAVVALRPPADGRRQADVLTCGTATTLQSVSLPAH